MQTKENMKEIRVERKKKKERNCVLKKTERERKNIYNH